MCPSSIGCNVGISTAIAVVEPTISTNVLSLRGRIRRISRVVISEPVAHSCILILGPRKHIAETSTRSVRDRGCSVVLVHSHLGVLAVARDICADRGRADGEDVGAVVPGGRREDGRVAGAVVEAAVCVVVASWVEGDAVVAGGEDCCCSYGSYVSATSTRKKITGTHPATQASSIRYTVFRRS